MKNLNQYIQEKYLIDIDAGDEEKLNDVVFVLGDWLFDKDTYNGRKNNRFEFLKDFDTIMDCIDYFPHATETLAKKLSMSNKSFTDFVNKYNDELYKKCMQYCQDIYDEIQF